MAAGLQCWNAQGQLTYSASDEMSSKLIAIIDLPRSTVGSGSRTLPATGYPKICVVPWATGYITSGFGVVSSTGGIAFFDQLYTYSNNVLTWNIPKSTLIGGLLKPWDELKLKMYVFTAP